MENVESKFDDLLFSLLESVQTSCGNFLQINTDQLLGLHEKTHEIFQRNKLDCVEWFTITNRSLDQYIM